MPPTKSVSQSDLDKLKNEIIDHIVPACEKLVKNAQDNIEAGYLSQIEALETELKSIASIVDDVASKSALPDVEPYLKTRMIGGAMDRKELYEMTFKSILHATVSTSMNILGRYIPSAENEEMARHEFDKIARLTDIAIEQIEKQYSPE